MPTATGLHRTVRVASDEQTVRSCWPAFRELRPHLQSEEELVDRWRKQVGEGYQIAYVSEGENVPAAAGYRLMHTMAWGRVLYIDDLVAIESRHGTGLGTLLLHHLTDQARRLACDAVHLDTGYHRHRAHRAYLRNGFQLEAHHMARQLSPRSPDPERAISPSR